MARPTHRLGLRTAFASIIGTARPRVSARSDVLARTWMLHDAATVRSTFNMKATINANPRCHDRLPRWTCSFANPPFSNPSIMRFDKVPDKLPDWWDDEEDEDDEPKEGGNDRGGGGSGEGNDGRGSGGNSGGGGGGYEEGLFATLLAMYVRAIRTNPVRTKAISTSLLSVIGDLLAQKIAQRDNAEFVLDTRRSASIGLWGLFIMGPALHYWYAVLDRLFFGKFAVLNKLLSDQLLFAPVFNAAFIVGVGSLEGNPLKEVAETVRTKFWPSMKANWTLWPAAQVVNFALVPKTFQIVYVNCVALVWSVILAYIAHDD